MEKTRRLYVYGLSSNKENASIYDTLFLLFLLYNYNINDLYLAFPQILSKSYSFSLSLLFCVPVILYIFMYFFHKKKGKINIFLFLIIAFLAVTILWANNNDNVRQFAAVDFSRSSFRTVFLLPLAYAIEEDPKTRLKQLYAIAFPMMIFRCILSYYGVYSEENYMHFGYSAVIWCCFGIQYLFTEKHIKLFAIKVAICVITCVFLLFFANRGVIAVLAVFLATCSFTYLSGTKRLTIFTLLFACVVVVFLRLDIIQMTFLGGKYSRTATLFEQGNLVSYLSGRDVLWQRCWRAFLQRPLFGYGYGYDRYLSGDPGLYAHNLFLELLLDFGLVGTIPVLLLLFFMAKHMILHAKSEEWKRLFLPYFIVCIVEMMVSSSIYRNLFFWCAVGIFCAEASWACDK